MHVDLNHTLNIWSLMPQEKVMAIVKKVGGFKDYDFQAT
jgi:hypothetical protein